jgi:hypothetical protein
LENILQEKKKVKTKSDGKDLKAVESAYKNRIVRLKEATENEMKEARFVARMEEIQTKELKKAVFAPNLSSMLLSAIFELQREFSVSTQEADHSDDEDEAMDEGDDDDDVPLVALGKRKSDETEDNQKGEKQQKRVNREDPKISLEYLIRVLEYISKTWGHCYREPSHEEYAWRWEVHHGSYSTNEESGTQSKSPRTPNSLPFENIQFGLVPSKRIRKEIASLPEKIKRFEDLVLSRSMQSSSGEVSTSSQISISSATPATSPDIIEKLDIPNEPLDQYCLAVHLLSPAGSGLYDELLALIKMDILKIRSGIPVLKNEWWANVDIHILDDMATAWSSEVDPDGKYCINEELRDTLEEQWKRYDYGWALNDDPKELVFDYSVLDEWRETFEGRLEEKANRSEGIGRFGL